MTGPDTPMQPTRPARGLRHGALRGGVIVVLLVAWLALGGIGGSYQGRLGEVQENDNASFLPEGAESTRVQDLQASFNDDQALPAFVVLERPGGLASGDLPAIAAWAEGVPDLPIELAEGTEDQVRVGDYLTGPPVPVPSEDGEAVLLAVLIDGDAAGGALPDDEPVLSGVVTTLRADLTDLRADLNGGDQTELTSYVTGPGGQLADLTEAFGEIDGLLLGVALSVVFVILLIVYRSPILPFAVLLTSLFALGGASLIVFHLASADLITLNGQSQGILFILVVGAATDYALLLVARYREELHDSSDHLLAVRRAWRASVEPIAASAATVVLGLLCLLLSDLNSNRGLGPVAAVGIVMAFLAALSLLPVLLAVPSLLLTGLVAGLVAGGLAATLGGTAAGAGAGVVLAAACVLAILRWRLVRADTAPDSTAKPPLSARTPSGRWIFWPAVPRVDHRHGVDALGAAPDAGATAKRGIWARVAGVVGRRPRQVWIITAVVLAACAAFVPTLRADGVSQSDLFLNETESVTGEDVLAAHYPAGSGTPAVVVGPADDLDRILSVASDTEGVASATAVTEDPSGQGEPAGQGEARVVDGLVELEVILTPTPDSDEGRAVIEDLRLRLDEVGDDVLVGGQTAVNIDTRDTSERDLRVIIPTVLLVILLVLIGLLRSLVAPLVLVAANILSFGAALGVSALVFDRVLGFPGADPSVPLFGFVFLVALGIDYSIFLMTRVREESLHRGPRPGVLRGLTVTGGVITSAGVVLAATFSALAVVPILFLAQIAFIVAFGVLLDTLVVRSLLVPALAHDLGRRVWWPGAMSTSEEPLRPLEAARPDAETTVVRD